MIRRVARFADQYDMFPAEGVVLCAVSGGADSVCLLHLLAELGRTRGFRVVAAHFNHQLRAEESDRDEAFVRALCAAGGIPCLTGRADVSGEAARRGRGVEETARALRYAFLRRTARAHNAVRIATAHNADDNAETVLLRLLRGAGLSGLSGIPPRRGEIIRPLLEISRAEILDYLSDRHLAFVEDSSNEDNRYTRNWVRHEVLPLLRTRSPQIGPILCRTAALLRRDERCLREEAERICALARIRYPRLEIPAAEVARLPDALATRVVLCLLERLRRDGPDRDPDEREWTGGWSAAHLDAAVRLCRETDPSARMDLPGGWTVERAGQKLIVSASPLPAPVPFPPRALERDGETLIPGVPWRVFCRPVACPEPETSSAGHFYLAADRLDLDSLIVRPRQTGDKLSLPRRTGHKSLKKLMIDAKLPRWERNQIPILADRNGVIAAAGFGPDQHRLARAGQMAYEILMLRDSADR